MGRISVPANGEPEYTCHRYGVMTYIVSVPGRNGVESELFTAEQLAQRVGLHRGTIRNYVWRRVIPPPYGKGRNARYGWPHLHIILSMQEERARRMRIADWADQWNTAR